jgi:PmbA protein
MPNEAAADTFDTERLQQSVEAVLARARARGATSAEAVIRVGRGLSVTVRLGEVETIEHRRDRSLALTAYCGQRKGTATTTDFSPDGLQGMVYAACGIARHSAEDRFAGLADPADLAWTYPELQLCHPWEIQAEDAIELVRRCEDAARRADRRITKSEGATFSSHRSLHVYGNTHGFVGAIPSTRHHLSCAVIATEDGAMERDSWYTAARAPEDIEQPESVGLRAARRALRRLGARRLATAELPVMFAAEVAGSLLGHLVGAVRGGALYRRASFLVDHLGRRVFPANVRVREQPHLEKAIGSAPFDSEGVATTSRDLVSDGVLQRYVLDSYSARRLGLKTTGNAGGVHNLLIESGDQDQAGLLRTMGRGVLVTELLGMGVNIVTGDYSRGAAGYWVEDGEVRYPVDQFTIAGSLRDMFMELVAVGNDIDTRGNIRTGSWLIGPMTVAGR